MGQMKKIWAELVDNGVTDEEMQELDFDLHDADDPEWWRQQDTDLDAEEMRSLEHAADRENERLGGWQ